MKRTIVAVVTAGSLGLLGLVGYGATQASASPESSAAPSASASAAHKGQHKGRKGHYLRRHTLHGEFVVHTRKGDKTLDVQRGQVTGISGDKVTVKSSDGYHVTWSLTDKTGVRSGKDKADRSALKKDVKVQVVGVRTSNTHTALRIRVAAKS